MPPRNPYICLSIVAVLGACTLLGTAGLLVLSLYDHKPPESVVAIVSGCAGALSSFLVSVPRGSVGGDDHHELAHARANAEQLAWLREHIVKELEARGGLPSREGTPDRGQP